MKRRSFFARMLAAFPLLGLTGIATASQKSAGLIPSEPTESFVISASIITEFVLKTNSLAVGDIIQLENGEMHRISRAYEIKPKGESNYGVLTTDPSIVGWAYRLSGFGYTCMNVSRIEGLQAGKTIKLVYKQPEVWIVKDDAGVLPDRITRTR